MRILGLSLALLAACSDNPVFGLTTDPGSGGPDSTGPATSTAPPTSGDPTGPVDTSATSAPGETGETGVVQESTETTAVGETTLDPSDPMTTMLAMPGTVDSTDTDPGSTTNSSDPNTTGLPVDDCPLNQPMLPSKLVKDLELMQLYQDCVYPSQEFFGQGELSGGKLLYSGGTCLGPSSEPVIEFGSGYPAPDHAFCGVITVYWADSCKVGALSVRDVEVDKDIFAVYYSPTATEPNNFPFTPEVDTPSTCMCPDLSDNCCEYIPGDHNLLVDGTKIPPGGPTFVQSKTAFYYNFQAQMSPACVDDLDVKLALAWMAHRQF